MISIDDYFQGAQKANGLIGRTSLLNKRAGKFYNARCKVTRQLRTEDRMGLIKKWIIWRQNRIYTDKFWRSLVFDVLICFACSISFKFIHSRCPSITLWRNNVFHNLSKNYFPSLRSLFVGLAESHETSESEP